MFGNSSESEMDIGVDTTMETKPTIEKEKKRQKVREKPLSNKTYERFTNYDGVMCDDNLSLPQKIIHLGKTIDDAMRRKVLWASLQGELFEKCFHQLKKVYKQALEEMKITREGALFLRTLYKLIIDYSELQFCTVSLCFFFTVTSR